MYFGDGFYMGGMHGLWWIFWIVLIGALVYSIRGRSSGHRRGPKEMPHEALRRRLADGEIDAHLKERSWTCPG